MRTHPIALSIVPIPSYYFYNFVKLFASSRTSLIAAYTCAFLMSPGILQLFFFTIIVILIETGMVVHVYNLILFLRLGHLFKLTTTCRTACLH